MLKNFALVLFLTSSLFCFGKSDGGFAFEGSIGLPNVTIQNPDGSNAYYSGLSVIGGVSQTLFEGNFSAKVTGSLKYLDLQNAANHGSQKEVANHVGPGLGLHFSFAKIAFGMDYHLMAARHYSVGTISNAMEYDYSALSYFAGVSFPLGSLAFGVNYHMTSATLEKSKTQLTKDSAYSDTLIMFQLIWNTGDGVTGFIGNLVK